MTTFLLFFFPKKELLFFGFFFKKIQNNLFILVKNYLYIYYIFTEERGTFQTQEVWEPKLVTEKGKKKKKKMEGPTRLEVWRRSGGIL